MKQKTKGLIFSMIGICISWGWAVLGSQAEADGLAFWYGVASALIGYLRFGWFNNIGR